MREGRRRRSKEWEKGVGEVTKEVTMVWKEREEMKKRGESKITTEVIKWNKIFVYKKETGGRKEEKIGWLKRFVVKIEENKKRNRKEGGWMEGKRLA